MSARAAATLRRVERSQPRYAQRMRFAVTTISPPDYPHSQAFREVALSVHHGLLELGHDSVLSTRLDNRRRRHIVLGANKLADHPQATSADTIIYNLEQVTPGSKWFSDEYLDLLRSRPVWDYSTRNIAALRKLGVDDVTEVPIGYVPQLSRIEPTEKDIDVLFYGSINPRRREVLDALDQAGPIVYSAFGVYGDQRDAMIARARIVLNMHYYEAKVLEIVRVSWLLANRCFVVCERGADAEMEHPFESGIAYCDYDALVDTCRHYLAHPEQAAAIADAGLALMQQRPTSAYLAAALSKDGLIDCTHAPA